MSRPSHTSFVGVLGWPLEHTLSPALHNAAFRAANLDWCYLAWPVEPRSLGAAVEGVRALGAMGANVTMPHKESILEHLDDVSGDAAAVGAVNTVQRSGDRLIGHNTDIDGFREFLEADAGADASGKRVLLLGAGGAARGVVKALEELGAAEISVAARDALRARRLESISEVVSVSQWSQAEKAASKADIIVNATPLGMRGEDLLGNASWRPGQLVVDLVYSPPSTRLVERARAGGADAWGGLGMLIHQAAASFQIWTGSPPSLDALSVAALRAIGSAHRNRG